MARRKVKAPRGWTIEAVGFDTRSAAAEVAAEHRNSKTNARAHQSERGDWIVISKKKTKKRNRT